MIGDTSCCGFHFKKDSTTILGLITFSLPIIILCAITIPILAVMGKINRHVKKIRKQIIIIIMANLHLIHATPLNPKAQCALAGKIFSYSPKFAGIIYRYFNISILILLWLGIIFCLYLIVPFIGN